MTGYKYQGGRGAMSDAEVHARITAARAQAGGNGQPSPEPETNGLRAVPQLKGAVKVGRFPEKSRYPFRQIADDGGVWQLDPAVFKVTPAAIVQAARKWAGSHGLTVKVTTDDGMAYVQFRKDGA